MVDDKLRLARCFSSVFPEIPAKDIQNSSLKSVPRWDSMETITLLSVIEEEFGIQFELEEIERLSSFSAILQRLESCHVRASELHHGNATV